jgi:hypothetical protein
MTAHATTQPSIPIRNTRALLAVAALAVVLLLVSAGVAALVSDGSSGTSSTAATPVAAASADSCPGDSGVLLNVAAGLPVADLPAIMGSLSPVTASMIRTATAASAQTLTFPGAPDAPTLAGVLSRISPKDSAVILAALSPQRHAAVQAAIPRVCG